MADPAEESNDFYSELEDASHLFRQRQEERERPPGCVAVFLGIFTLGFFAALFFLVPAFVYNKAEELYHFSSCEQATIGRVLTCERTGSDACKVSIAYTPEGGSECRLEQESRQPELYPPDTSVKVRYKEGHAFIDNGKEDKIKNLFPIVFLPVFWFIAYALLAALGVGILSKLRHKLAAKGRKASV